MTLDELTTPMTVAEAKAAIYDGLATSGVRTTNWKPGATTRTIIACVAIVLAAFSRLIALIAKGGFLETSEGAWLTLVAYYVYGVTRSPGTFASGTMRFDNAGGGVYSGGAGDLTVRSSLTNKTYRNTSAYAIGALASNVSIDFQAVELGSDSTAAANTIDSLVTTLSGVTCTNNAAFVGLDEESDVELRSRCSAKLGTLSPDGARDAYAYLARSATLTDGTPAGITRVRTTPDGLGTVYVYVASASGAVTGTDVDPTTPLGAAAKAIWEQCEPLAVSAVVASATGYTIAITYEAWVRTTSGMTSAQIEAAILSALETHFAELPIGGDDTGGGIGYVYRSGIIAAIGAAVPDVVRVDLSLPAADVGLLVANVPVLGAVTATINII